MPHIPFEQNRASTVVTRRRRPGGLTGVAMAAIIASALAGCKPSSLVDVQSPSTSVDPALVKTATAAVQLRAGALLRMTAAYGGSGYQSVITMSGFITDELTDSYNLPGTGSGDDRNVLNLTFPKNANGYAYDQIHSARVKAAQARQALQLYASDAPGVPHAWQGELYALEGYTVLWLAEQYCSGIPLTSAPLIGDQVPTRGFTTQELYQHAIALFDSALVVGADSAQFVNLASVGKGRALLGLGQFAAADSAVQNVPTDFVYRIAATTSSTDDYAYFWLPIQVSYGYYRVADHEGTNGLVWSTDPRTGVVTDSDQAGAMLWPAKYNINDAGVPDPTTWRTDVPVRLADGLEARLIHAEAALAAGGSDWLTTLNTLRSTCVGTAACAPIPGITSASLPALSDPGAPETRLDLVMQERAMWLYLTGHREGDLRRMARVYHRDPQTLWPIGLISGPAFPPLFPSPTANAGQPYGSDVVYGPDPAEQLHNSLYGGCYDHAP